MRLLFWGESKFQLISKTKRHGGVLSAVWLFEVAADWICCGDQGICFGKHFIRRWKRDVSLEPSLMEVR